VAGSGDCVKETSGHIKCGEIVDQVRNYMLPMKDSAPWS
jgi:hypothetical protein